MQRKEKEMDKEQKLKKYFEAKVNPIFERLIIDLLIDTPEKIVDYAQNWLNDKGRKLERGENIKGSKNRSQTPVISVQETPNYDFQTYKQQKTQKVEQSDEDVEEIDNEEEIYDEEEFDHFHKKNNVKPMRISVSAEAYGVFHKKGDYKPKIVPKTQQQKERIQQRLIHSFMFSELDQRDQKIVLDEMEEKHFNKGDHVIRQGEDGDCLFLVDSGILDCYRKFDKHGDDKYLKSYGPGDSFGELALLYNAPRAATIIAKEDSICFSLDRECFNNIVKEASVKRRDRYEDTLTKVDLLSSMESYERTQLSDGLKELKFSAGDIVIKEGEPGDKFYMIDHGELVALKTLEKGKPPQVVMQYKEGDYFGELALLKNIPRQATVQAKTDCILVYLDSKTFKRMLGPIESMLKRNTQKYEKYWNIQEEGLKEIERKSLKF